MELSFWEFSFQVFKCASGTCDRFYHPHCVAKLLPDVVKQVTKEFESNIADGNPFTCPLHYCCVCKGLENMMDPELQFAVCRRCPKAYHRKCLPRFVLFYYVFLVFIFIILIDSV